MTIRIKKTKINIKLFLILFISLLIMNISTYFLAGAKLKEIINDSQLQVFLERIDSIHNKCYLTNIQYILSKSNKATDYKLSALISLQQIFYTKDSPETYPFILDNNYKIVMHPELYRGQELQVNSEVKILIKELKSKNLPYIAKSIDKNWYLLKYFHPWDWVIFYKVPLEIKNSNVDQFLYSFTLVITIFSTITLILIFFITKKMLSPIINLSKASAKMAEGDLDYPLLKITNDELGVLTENFLTMRSTIQNNIWELNKTKSYLNNIINSMSSILIGVDNNLNIINLNNQAKLYLNAQNRYLIGRPLEKLFPEYRDFFSTLKDHLVTGEKIEKKKITYHKGSDTFHSEISVFPLISNRVEGAVIQIDDVTQQISLDEMMVQSEKMISIGGLAAGMAHEINNPLAIILQGIQLLEKKLFSMDKNNQKLSTELDLDLENLHKFLHDNQIFKMIDAIKEAAKRSAVLVKNMLSFVRKDISGEKVLASIESILDKSLEIAANDYDLSLNHDFRKIKIIKKYDLDLPKIKCENSKLQQVFYNILKNGAEAMREKKYQNSEPQFIIRTYQKDNYLIIEIEDNGPGIPEQKKNKVFEPFYTTKPVNKGTGIGLSVSYFIINERHNGQLSIESKEHEWTRFKIALPI